MESPLLVACLRMTMMVITAIQVMKVMKAIQVIHHITQGIKILERLL
jgi:hypothetical protein